MFGSVRTRLWLAAGLLAALVFASWGYAALMARHDSGLLPRLDALETALAAEDWPMASRQMTGIREAWRQARTVVELNYGYHLLIEGERSLQRLEGHVKTREAAPARVELGEFRDLWRWLKMVIPDGR